MKFNHTNKEPKYVVSVYAWNIEDQHYFHTFAEAWCMALDLQESGLEKGTIVRVYDLKNEIPGRTITI